MEHKAQYRNWMSINIAKTYLYETGMVDVYESEDNEFDFMCLIKVDLRKVFAVELKASQYSKSNILRIYKKNRDKNRAKVIPVLMMYINHVDKTGYFEIVSKSSTGNIEILTTQSLRKAIENLISNYEWNI